MSKKGISPLIGTVLLVAIVIAMILLIMLWITQTIKTQQERSTEALTQMDCVTDLGLELIVNPTTQAITLDNLKSSVGITKVAWRVYDSTGALAATQPNALVSTTAGANIIDAYGRLSADQVGVTCPVGGRVEAIATLENGVVCGDMPIESNC